MFRASLGMDEPVYNSVMSGAQRLGLIVPMLCCLAAAAVPAQPPQPTGLIAGTLRSADLGRPIRRATVKLVSAPPAQLRTTTTDANGRFRFAALPAADYTLSAAKPGFLEMTYGARRPGSG